MRFLGVFPFLCALTALVLSLLCLFAGTKPTFLQNAELLTLNTSMLGHTTLFNTSDNNNKNPFSSFVNSIEGDINGAVNNITSDIAKAINIHDFYTAHIMDFCEGYYEPSAVVTPGQKKPSMNVTKCSNTTALFHFDPTAIIQSELKSGVTLPQLHWPQQLDDGIRALEVASKVMFVFYVIGIIMTGFALIGALLGFLANGRISASINFVLFFLAFLALGIASAIATAIGVKFVHEVNNYGNDIGISASKGGRFLGMTWAATALMLLASIAWIAECCVGRKRTAYVGKERY